MAQEKLGNDGRESDGPGLLGLLTRAAQQLPGAKFAQEQLERVESRVLGELKHRMDRLEAQPARVASAVVIYASKTGSDRSLYDRMSLLMEQGAEQTEEQAEFALFQRIIDQLVPDEVRILSALSKGAVFPLMHIGVGPRVGPTTRRIAENLSTIGKPAGVTLLAQVPSYITHLRMLGVLESGAEDKAMEIKYQMLEGDTEVRRIVEETPRGAGSSVRYLRRTLRMSKFGSRFWDACRIG
jgi:hypothetical protein